MPRPSPKERAAQKLYGCPYLQVPRAHLELVDKVAEVIGEAEKDQMEVDIRVLGYSDLAPAEGPGWAPIAQIIEKFQEDH